MPQGLPHLLTGCRLVDRACPFDSRSDAVNLGPSVSVDFNDLADAEASEVVADLVRPQSSGTAWAGP